MPDGNPQTPAKSASGEEGTPTPKHILIMSLCKERHATFESAARLRADCARWSKQRSISPHAFCHQGVTSSRERSRAVDGL